MFIPRYPLHTDLSAEGELSQDATDLRQKGSWLRNALPMNVYNSKSAPLRELVNFLFAEIINKTATKVKSHYKFKQTLKAIIINLWFCVLIGMPIRYPRDRNWGIEYMDPNLPDPNPCRVKKMPEIRHPRPVPTEKDLWKVYDAAEGQDRVMLSAYLHLSARRGEIFRLKWTDVDFDNQRIRLSTKKRENGNLEYNWLPMTDELCEHLEAHQKDNASEWVFLNPKTEKPYVERKRWMKSLCRKAKVKPFGLHGIRHLVPSILAHHGVPAIQIQKILRHKRLGTTEGYLHHDKEADLKSALKALSRNKKPSEKPSTK